MTSSTGFKYILQLKPWRLPLIECQSFYQLSAEKGHIINLEPQFPIILVSSSQFRRLFMHHRLQEGYCQQKNKRWRKENLLSTIDTTQRGGNKLIAERIIHAAVFVLLLVGLFTLTGWMNYRYIQDEIILQVAGIALSWGIILLILYISFRRLKWRWWTNDLA